MSWDVVAKLALKTVKFRTVYSAVVVAALGCAAVLFVPESALKALSIADHTNRYRQYVGIAFVAVIVVLAFLSLLLVFRVVDSINSRVQRAKRIEDVKASRERRLHSLTEDEKMVLRYYIAKQERTNLLPLSDRVAETLVRAGILTRPAQLSTNGGCIYEISEEAWEHLNRNHGLLEGSTRYMRGNETIFTRRGLD